MIRRAAHVTRMRFMCITHVCCQNFWKSTAHVKHTITDGTTKFRRALSTPWVGPTRKSTGQFLIRHRLLVKRAPAVSPWTMATAAAFLRVGCA